MGILSERVPEVNRYLCPVCGYNKLEHPPEDYFICPSCGTEFGYDDFTATHDELRRRWLNRGAPWFSSFTAPPENWNPVIQLLNGRVGFVVETPRETTSLERIVIRVGPWSKGVLIA